MYENLIVFISYSIIIRFLQIKYFYYYLPYIFIIYSHNIRNVLLNLNTNLRNFFLYNAFLMCHYKRDLIRTKSVLKIKFRIILERSNTCYELSQCIFCKVFFSTYSTLGYTCARIFCATGLLACLIRETFANASCTPTSSPTFLSLFFFVLPCFIFALRFTNEACTGFSSDTTPCHLAEILVVSG